MRFCFDAAPRGKKGPEGVKQGRSWNDLVRYKDTGWNAKARKGIVIRGF